jgi:hypothetical protein
MTNRFFLIEDKSAALNAASTGEKLDSLKIFDCKIAT